MRILTNAPETSSPAGLTGESDWQTLLDYTGEVTEEVVRSWWADVPVSSWPTVKEHLEMLELEHPELVALIRRVTGL